tara:strand:+ start:297 stop:755 length:459 start_codon:yes stop_codon:yes gene_type:complete
MSSSNTRLRAQLNHEIEDVLSITEELRPFLSAWSVIEQRFCGVSDVKEVLDPVKQIHCLIMAEQVKTALITEELFLSWLLKLPFLSKNIVCVESGRVWEPLMQSFEEFKEDDSKFRVSDCLNSNEKINEFQLWVIQLCNWDGSGILVSKKIH